MKTLKDFNLFIAENFMDFIMWLQVLSLFYIYVGIYSGRRMRYRGAPTRARQDLSRRENKLNEYLQIAEYLKKEKRNKFDNAVDKEQRSPNTCSSQEHN